MPGQRGNLNAQTHGVYTFLAHGRLPKGCSYVRRLLTEFRSALESGVQDIHGQIGLFHAATISSALRHEGRALLLAKFLRDDPDMKLADRVAILKDIGAASDSRDRCIKALNLDKAVADAGPLNSLLAIAKRVAQDKEGESSVETG